MESGVKIMLKSGDGVDAVKSLRRRLTVQMELFASACIRLQYDGREKKLFKNLAKKYGRDPTDVSPSPHRPPPPPHFPPGSSTMGSGLSAPALLGLPGHIRRPTPLVPLPLNTKGVPLLAEVEVLWLPWVAGPISPIIYWGEAAQLLL